MAEPSQSLISIEQFQRLQQSDKQWIVIDVRTRMHYSLGHIPGAFNLWRPDYEADEGEYPFSGMRASPAKMEKLLSGLGVTPDTHIVLYDEYRNLDSSRLWWILKLYGHNEAMLLDGGLVAWKHAGYDTVLGCTNPSVKKQSNYHFNVDQAKPTWLAKLPDVEVLLKDKCNILLDVRAESEVTGKQKKSGAFRKGRIPGSLWFEYDQVVGNTGFLPASRLQDLFMNCGVGADANIIVYCQSGVRSANTLFVLKELLNYPNVKNFDGSWIEWSYRTELPVDSGLVTQK